ncbi:MAG: cytochrome oxidase putative small subunit CydP [Steroidobacteraceae bacterium]
MSRRLTADAKRPGIDTQNAIPPTRWAPRLRRHLIWAIALKLALVALLYALFFSPDHRPQLDPSGVSDRLGLH